MKPIVTSQLPVMALEIDEEGTVAQKSMQLTRQGQLDNTLLDALYPGIRVATVEIPGAELDDYGRAKVEQALAKFTVGAAALAAGAVVVVARPPRVRNVAMLLASCATALVALWTLAQESPMDLAMETHCPARLAALTRLSAGWRPTRLRVAHKPGASKLMVGS